MLLLFGGVFLFARHDLPIGLARDECGDVDRAVSFAPASAIA